MNNIKSKINALKNDNSSIKKNIKEFVEMPIISEKYKDVKTYQELERYIKNN